jgi:RNA polymerase sigma factor (sigma-70 family)
MERIGPDILGRLFDEHASALLLFARQWCDAPEDIVQDAFASLAGQKTVPERVVPWLYRVVRNGAISASRQSRRRRRREERAAGLETAPSDPLFAATDDRIDAELASRLLADLDGETREVIVGRLWGGLTFEEIAKLQSCSLSTAHRRYQAGLARLHARLDPQWTSNTQTATPKST